MKIQRDCLVEIDVHLFDEQGEKVEAEEGPVLYVHGRDSIAAGLEQALEGREVGAELSVELEPADAFGDYNPDGILSVPRNQFPPDAELVPGDIISVTVEPEEDDDPDLTGEMEMVVLEIRPDAITLDANHPLAGQKVKFEVKVLAVREATADEIAELGGA